MYIYIIYILLYYYSVENNNCEDGDVRLQNGTLSINGRVEVCRYGNWGSICADKWDNDDARVACRQLGYNFSEGDCLCVFQVAFEL